MNAPLDATNSAVSEERDEEPGLAWEPFTPGGVVAFGAASFGRLWFVQTLVALGAAAAIFWFLTTAWFPVVEQGIQQLPASGTINRGLLEWPGTPALRLAENRFLSLTVDLKHGGALRSYSHLQIEFGSHTLRVYSLAGCLDAAYPAGYVMAFNRSDLEPMWGAWSPWLAVGAAFALSAGLLVTWMCLSVLYAVPVFLTGFFMNRALGILASLKVAGAAQMPGAMLLILGFIAYRTGLVDVLRFGVVFVAHFLVTWIYLFMAPAFAPSLPGVRATSNPFKAAE